MPFQNILKTDSSCRHDYRSGYTPHNFKTADAYKGMPLVLHSNGSVCWYVTDYCIERYLSKENKIKPSTLMDEARSLSRFIQYLDGLNTPIILSECTDQTIFDYVEYLLDKKKNRNPPQNNQINKLIIRALKLLLWLQESHFIPAGVISDDEEKEAKINVTYREFTQSFSGKKRTFKTVDHPALLPYQNYVPRRPISDAVIDKLYEAGYAYSDNPFIHDRWETILEVLEQTGVRVSELATITTGFVIEAYNKLQQSKVARLKVITTKGKNDGTSREIPVPDSTIEQLFNFMQNTRNPLVEKKIAEGSLSYEHKKIFINENGKPMTPKGISRLFSEIKKKAKITEPASPHLFRHRYITKQVKSRLAKLLESTSNYNVGLDAFVTKKVIKLTGHAHHDSLLGYVDFAMEEMGVLQDVEEQVKKDFEDTSLIREINKILSKAKLRHSPSSKLKELLSAVKKYSE
ncbi:hypothetical protein ALT721_1360044 [Alteromonas alvinellae]